MSIVELIVYVVVAGLVLTGIASLFVNSWISQTQTTNRDSATGNSAVVGASLTQSIRNASDFKVEAGGKTVRAIVATGASGWECRAWALTSGGDLIYKASPTSIAVPTGATAPAGWTQLAAGVTGTLTGGVPFVDAGSSPKRLEIGLTFTTKGQAAPTTNGVTAQAKISGGGPCW